MSFFSKVDQWLGPSLLRFGIRLHAKGFLGSKTVAEALIPNAFKLITVEYRVEANRAVEQGKMNQSFLDSQWKKFRNNIKQEDEEDADGIPVVPLSRSELRLGVLEKYLRSALLPTETWEDVERLFKCEYPQLIAWVRKEFLLAKYGDDLKMITTTYPDDLGFGSPQVAKKLRSAQGGIARLYYKIYGDATKTKENETTNSVHDIPFSLRLPASNVVTKAFQLESWEIKKKLKDTSLETIRIATEKLNGTIIEWNGGSMSGVADVPTTASLAHLTLEEVLEVAGCHIMLCGAFNAYCEQTNIFQLWTKEYVSKLGNYLVKRAEKFDGETMIIDVGAGDGCLAQALRDYFDHGAAAATATGKISRPINRVVSSSKQQKKPPVQSPPPKDIYDKIPLVIATDDGSWNINAESEVLEMGVEEAMETYGPNEKWQVIVVCSWMPMGVDWTAEFRKVKVDEYILIGECDDGQCGDNWATWGNHYYYEDGDDDNGDYTALDEVRATAAAANATYAKCSSLPKPYEADGYNRKELDVLSPYQFSRYDCSVSKLGRTVSFRYNRTA